MENPEINNSNLSNERDYYTEEQSFFSIQDLVQEILKHKLWILLSLIVCMLLAFVYIKKQAPTYQIAASILIKDAQKNASNELAQFQDLGLFSGKSEVENEMIVLRSKRLSNMVISALDLDVVQTQKTFWREKTIYGDAPLSVSLVNRDSLDAFNFKLKAIDKETFELSDFEQATNPDYKQLKSRTLKGEFGKLLQTPVGEIKIETTPYYTDKNFGQEYTIHKLDRRKVLARYNSSLQVGLTDKKSTIVNLSIKDQNLKRGRDFINTLIDVYNKDVMDDNKSIAINTAAFIDERLAMIGGELGAVDTEIESYKKDNMIMDISVEAGSYIQNSSELQKNQLSLENQLNLAKYIKEYLQETVGQNELLPANLGLNEGGIDNMIGKYNELKLKYDRLKQQSSENNQVVQDANAQLVAMRKSLSASIDNYIKTLKMQTRELDSEIRKNQRLISAVPTREKIMSTILRQQKIKEELYLYLLNKREENALRMAITESNTKTVDAADGSSSPVSPRSSLIYLAALVFGLAIPLVYIYLKIQLNTRVRGRKDLEPIKLIPFLGEIPVSDKQDLDDEDVVVKDGSRDSVSEAFRIMRSNIDFMKVGPKGCQVLMFTSAHPASGKSFVAVNLAVSLALTGKKVVALDLDIRKGSLTDRITASGVGVTDYLFDERMTVDMILSKSEHSPNLSLILAGPVPPNPSELLLSDRLDTLIEELRTRFDYILIDSVPAMQVADALITNRVVDLTVYVIRENLMDRRYLPEVKRLYLEGKFKNMALVYNAASGANSGYGYAYGYGYHAGDKQDKVFKRKNRKKSKAWLSSKER